MAHKHTRSRPHAELRHRLQIPIPAVEEVEQRLAALLSLSVMATRQMERRDTWQPQRLICMRQRLLTLPIAGALPPSAADAVSRTRAEARERVRGCESEIIPYNPNTPHRHSDHGQFAKCLGAGRG